MRPPMTPSSNAYAVEQCDREAAADLAETIQGWCNIGGNDVAAIRNGFWDTDQDDLGALVQAFAKHRHEQTSALREALEDALDTMDKLRADLAEEAKDTHAQRIVVLDLSIATSRLALRAGGVS